MPEGYTHLRIAKNAAAAVRYRLKWPAAFAAGANGPDSFFCYEVWRKPAKRRYDLPALGRRLHEENTGPFLLCMFRRVRTVAQIEFVLGFLSHYAADTVLHPYIAALCQPGMPYAEAGGHGYFEIALDSTLHEQDTGDALVPGDESSPPLVGQALAEVSQLLHECLLEVYRADVPVEYIADSFYYTNRLRRLFVSRHGVRRVFFSLVEPLFGGKGFITGHVSPRKLKDGLPDAWTDPYSGRAREGGVSALIEQAQQRSTQFMAAAILVWTGRQPRQMLADVWGSMSYGEGRPTPKSDPGYVPQDPTQEFAPVHIEEPSPEAEADLAAAADHVSMEQLATDLAAESPAAPAPAPSKAPAETAPAAPPEAAALQPAAETTGAMEQLALELAEESMQAPPLEPVPEYTAPAAPAEPTVPEPENAAPAEPETEPENAAPAGPEAEPAAEPGPQPKAEPEPQQEPETAPEPEPQPEQEPEPAPETETEQKGDNV